MIERSGRRPKLARSTPPAAEADPKEFAASVGEAIRVARQQYGWTQVELAEAAALSPNYIARLERGELGASLFVARQICEALDIDLEALLAPPGNVQRTGKRRVR
jgi:transcriptional regulator with XRE-family HTH domain